MAKKNPSTQPAKTDPPSANSPLTAAVAATMPLVYSTQIALAQSSGPLPPPEFLRQYEALQPGTADRILKMAEDEANHRRKMEAEVISIQGRDQCAYRRSELLGQVFGLAIGISAISGAVIAAVHGAQIAAAFIGTSGVTGLVTAFIVGRNLLMKQMHQEHELRQAEARHHKEESKPPKSAGPQESPSSAPTQQITR